MRIIYFPRTLMNITRSGNYIFVYYFYVKMLYTTTVPDVAETPKIMLLSSLKHKHLVFMNGWMLIVSSRFELNIFIDSKDPPTYSNLLTVFHSQQSILVPFLTGFSAKIYKFSLKITILLYVTMAT